MGVVRYGHTPAEVGLRVGTAETGNRGSAPPEWHLHPEAWVGVGRRPPAPSGTQQGPQHCDHRRPRPVHLRRLKKLHWSVGHPRRPPTGSLCVLRSGTAPSLASVSPSLRETPALPVSPPHTCAAQNGGWGKGLRWQGGLWGFSPSHFCWPPSNLAACPSAPVSTIPASVSPQNILILSGTRQFLGSRATHSIAPETEMSRRGKARTSKGWTAAGQAAAGLIPLPGKGGGADKEWPFLLPSSPLPPSDR